ncbi:MAG: hypothetical protein FWG38_06965 [Defluviitaleaceae bacterium]|jgi:hypothetical protein|nr:hypothetical protein [Defluviitaleaceae bacterium]
MKKQTDFIPPENDGLEDEDFDVIDFDDLDDIDFDEDWDGEDIGEDSWDGDEE